MRPHAEWDAEAKMHPGGRGSRARTRAARGHDIRPGALVGEVGSLVSSLAEFAAPAGHVDNVTDVDAGHCWVSRMRFQRCSWRKRRVAPTGVEPVRGLGTAADKFAVSTGAACLRTSVHGAI